MKKLLNSARVQKENEIVYILFAKVRVPTSV